VRSKSAKAGLQGDGPIPPSPSTRGAYHAMPDLHVLCFLYLRGRKA